MKGPKVLAGLLADLRSFNVPRRASREGTVSVHRSSFAPWGSDGQPCTQRHFYSSPETVRILVAGRQSGKTECAAAETLDCMLWKPGTYSALLAPTYKTAKAAIRKVVRMATQIGGFTWKEQAKELHHANGSIFAVFSADRKESVRGPSITGLLWIDEGAFLHVLAWEAALGAMAAAKHARVMITTTPAGKNWVHREWSSEEPGNKAFRWPAEASPFCNVALVEKLRRKMGKLKAAQEFDAVFVDTLLLTFSDRSKLWVDSFPPRKPERLKHWIGVDVAKSQDWTVCVLMNQHGEGTFLSRQQKYTDDDDPTFYPRIVKHLADLAEKHSAVIVIDVAKGTGPGEVIADYLETEYGLKIVRVQTGSRKQKSKIVEQAAADVEWDRIRLLRNEFQEQADYELSQFQGEKRVQDGQEVMVYQGPQEDGEFDDCVIAMCLANHGRVLEDDTDPLDGDFSGFRPSKGVTAGGQFSGFGGFGGGSGFGKFGGFGGVR